MFQLKDFHQSTEWSGLNTSSVGDVCYMQPNIWYYYIISTMQSNLVQAFSLYYSVRYYWLNKLNIAVNSVPKYLDMSETL